MWTSMAVVRNLFRRGEKMTSATFDFDGARNRVQKMTDEELVSFTSKVRDRLGPNPPATRDSRSWEPWHWYVTVQAEWYRRDGIKGLSG
jgi:hypothetical protein